MELSCQGDLACPGVGQAWRELADPHLQRSSHSAVSMNTVPRADCHLQMHTPQGMNVSHFHPAYLGKVKPMVVQTTLVQALTSYFY